MTLEEYMKLFHDLQLNLVAFNPLLQCNEEVLKLVNAAIAAEREACANMCKSLSKDRGMILDEVFKEGVLAGAVMCSEAIRARGQSEVS